MSEEQIPKIINYCWFGKNKKSKLIEKCMNSWEKFCPEYEIIEWNELNFDIECNKYVKEAYEQKKWAFVSDYARLWAVYNKGGVYFDTDVELIKKPDELLSYNAFFSCEKSNRINTGIGFGATSKNSTIKVLLDSYNDLNFFDKKTKTFDLTPCTHRNTEVLEKIFGNLDDNVNSIIGDNIRLLGSEYFCPFDNKTGVMNKTKNTIGIHWFDASWRSKSINLREHVLRPVKRILNIR